MMRASRYVWRWAESHPDVTVWVDVAIIAIVEVVAYAIVKN